MSGGPFTCDKFVWLEQVASADGPPPSSVCIAVILSCYLNQEPGDAWPSIRRLCAELKMSDRVSKRRSSPPSMAGISPVKRAVAGPRPTITRSSATPVNLDQVFAYTPNARSHDPLQGIL